MASVHDFTGDGSKGDGTGKHAVPADNATDPERYEWLCWAVTATEGRRVGEITRYGGQSCTPMTIEILPPGDGRPKLVRFEQESEAAKHATLRQALTRDAGLKAAPIVNAKIAGDVYYVLCKLARVVGPVNPRDAIREWIDDYRDEATRRPLSLRKGVLHHTLATVRSWPYSKRRINLWLARLERLGPGREAEAGEPPRPLLIVDEQGGEWAPISHLACYVRWGRDQGETISETALAGRIVELGGTRRKLSAWRGTTRKREDRIERVLVRLPAVGGDPEEEAGGPDV